MYMDNLKRRPGLVYADFLDFLTKAGLFGLCASYLVYIFWGDSLAVPPEAIARHWGLSGAEYALAVAGTWPGGAFSFPDLLPQVCTWVIAGISCAGMVFISIFYARMRKALHCALSLLQVLVFLFAISGLAVRL